MVRWAAVTTWHPKFVGVAVGCWLTSANVAR
jgi:hypothetical protein